MIGGETDNKDEDKQDGQSKGCCSWLNCCGGQDSSDSKTEIEVAKNNDKNEDGIKYSNEKYDGTIKLNNDTINLNNNYINNIHKVHSGIIANNLNRHNINIEKKEDIIEEDINENEISKEEEEKENKDNNININNSNLINNNINPSINNSNLINNNFNNDHNNNQNKENKNNNISNSLNDTNKDFNKSNSSDIEKFSNKSIMTNCLKKDSKENEKEIDDDFFIKGDGMEYYMDVTSYDITPYNNTFFCASYEDNKDKSEKIEFTLQFKRKQKEKEDCCKDYKMKFERDRGGQLKVTMQEIRRTGHPVKVTVSILDNDTVKEGINNDFNNIIKEYSKDTDSYFQNSEVDNDWKEYISKQILLMIKNNFFVDNLKKKLKLSDDIIKDIVPKPFLNYHNVTHKQDKIMAEYFFGVIPGIKKESKKNDNRKSNNNFHVDLKSNNNKKTLQDKNKDFFFMSGIIEGISNTDTKKTEKKNNNNNNINNNLNNKANNKVNNKQGQSAIFNKIKEYFKNGEIEYGNKLVAEISEKNNNSFSKEEISQNFNNSNISANSSCNAITNNFNNNHNNNYSERTIENVFNNTYWQKKYEAKNIEESKNSEIKINNLEVEEKELATK